jgi:hypothetical protein
MTIRAATSFHCAACEACENPKKRKALSLAVRNSSLPCMSARLEPQTVTPGARASGGSQAAEIATNFEQGTTVAKYSARLRSDRGCQLLERRERADARACCLCALLGQVLAEELDVRGVLVEVVRGEHR